MTLSLRKVLLDANVLYQAPLRDTLLRAAARGLFQVYWSEQILDEAVGALLLRGRISPEQGRRLRETLERAFPEAQVTDYEPFLPEARNEPKDRHVVAVALKAGAQVIVTGNLADFMNLPEDIEAQSPDVFLCDLFDLEPELMADVVVEQAAALARPPRSFDALVRGLARIAPRFAAALHEHAQRPRRQ
jgi:predicted nucleic acid-binding protein